MDFRCFITLSYMGEVQLNKILSPTDRRLPPTRFNYDTKNLKCFSKYGYLKIDCRVLTGLLGNQD